MFRDFLSAPTHMLYNVNVTAKYSDSRGPYDGYDKE